MADSSNSSEAPEKIVYKYNPSATQKTTKDKIEMALDLKEEGNILFKEGDYKGALTSYHQMYMYVHGLNDGSAESVQAAMSGTSNAASSGQVRDLKLSHFLNVAMCHIKLGNPAKAITNCTKALQMDPDNVKALFRRGKSYIDTGDFDKARADLTQAAKLDPSDAAVRNEFRRLDTALKAQTEKEKKVYSSFFTFKSAPKQRTLEAVPEATGSTPEEAHAS